MVNCGPGVIVAGSEPPAMSVQYADPRCGFSGYSVIFSELDPDDPEDATPTEVVCLAGASALRRSALQVPPT